MRQLLFKKLGIAQIMLSQHPYDFLEAGRCVLSNSGNTSCLSMQRTAVEKLNLPEELERVLIESVPGQCVLRIGSTYVPSRHLGEPHLPRHFQHQSRPVQDYAPQGTGLHQAAPIDGLIRPHKEEGTQL